MPFSILHCADTHLGVETYGRTDPSSGLNTRLQDFARSLRFTFQTAIDEQVDLVVFAGDAFRTCDPTPTHLREFASAIQMLADQHIPVVMVTGNHDAPVSFGKASSIDIFRTLGAGTIRVADEPSLFDIPTRKGRLQVACLPWLHRSRIVADPRVDGLGETQTTDLLAAHAREQIGRLARAVDTACPSILVAHAALSDAVLSGTERTASLGRDPALSTRAFARSEFDYVALGHIHRYQNLNTEGAPPVVYAGSIEHVDFGEENEPKGFVLVQIDDARSPRATSIRFVTTPARRFVTIEARIPVGGDSTAIIVDAIDRHDIKDAIVRVFYQGDAEDVAPPDTPSLRSALKDAAHVALIARRAATPAKVRRAPITEEMNLAQAVRTYISVHPELASLEQDLIDRSHQLAAEIEDSLT